MLRRRFLASLAGAAAGLARRSHAAGSSLGKLAFTQADGLWIRDLPEGKPVRLAAGTKIGSPCLSPSGRWISYTSGGALYVASTGGGTPRKLGSGAGQWRPGRDELLVETPEGLGIFSAADGLAGLIPGAGLPVAFSPDGREIVYGDEVTAGQGQGPAGEPPRTGRLCRVELDHPGKPKVLFSKHLAGLFPAFWTGDWVIFREDPDFSASIAADGLELFCVPAAGGSPRSLGVVTLLASDMLALSAHGKLAASVGSGREDWQDRRIAVVDPAVAAISYLTGADMVAVSPAWSPAGDRIAFAAAPAPASDSISGGEEAKRILSRRRIWIADATGTRPLRAVTGDALYRDEKPMWSADGRHILFCRIDGRGRQTLWMMDAEGSAPVEIGDLSAGSEDPGWGYYGHIDWGKTLDWRR